MDLENLMSNPIVGLVSIIIAIVGILLTIFFGIVALRATRKYKEFSYFRRTHQVIKTNFTAISKLQLLYDGKDIKDFSITKYAIWNSGNEKLEGKDIIEEEPLMISTNDNDVEILNAEIIDGSETKKANKFEIYERSNKHLKLRFKYAGRKDGIVIQILHTGTASFNVVGEIEDGKKLKNRNITQKTLKILKLLDRIYIPVLIVSGLIILILGSETLFNIFSIIIPIFAVVSMLSYFYIVVSNINFPTKFLLFMEYYEEDD